jgi:hypothetical protein
MKFRLLISGLLLAVVSLPAAAQGVAGKWNANMEGPQGAISMSFSFMVEDGELKGTMSNDFMGEVPISDGKVDGNELSFKVAIEGAPGGGEMALTYTGKLENDEIMLTMGMEGGPPGGMPPLMLKRAE